MLQAPFRMFGFLLLQTQRASASASRIFEVLDEKPEITDLPTAVKITGVRDSIRFQNVNFSYSGSQSLDPRRALVRGQKSLQIWTYLSAQEKQ